MSNKNNVKKVGDGSIEENEERGWITDGMDKGMERDNDVGECFLETDPSTKDKEENSDDGNVIEKLGKLTSQNASMVAQ